MPYKEEKLQSGNYDIVVCYMNRVSSAFGCQFYRIIGHFYTKI